MFNDRRYQEAVGILIILCSVILLLSLYSYSLKDFELIANNRPANNIIGPLGAYFSDFLRGAFGYSSYILFFIFGVAGWRILKMGTIIDVLERIFSLFFLMLTSSIMLSLLYKTAIPHFSGGYIGLYLSRIFVSFFSEVGTYLITGILNLIGLILLGIISLSSILEYTNSNSESISKFLKNILNKISSFKLKREVPINRIEEAIEKKKKPPWIIKKKIIINVHKRDKGTSSIDDDPKLIEFKKSMPAEDETFPPKMEVQIPDDIFKDIKISHPYQEEPFLEDDEFDEYDDAPEDMESFAIENDALSLSIPGAEDELMYAGDEFAFDHNPQQLIANDESPVNYSDESVIDAIETNRITAVEPEIEIKTAVIIDDPEELDEFVSDELEETDEDSDINNNGFPSPERVFNQIPITEGYSIPMDFLDNSTPFDIESWKNEARRTSELLIRTMKDFGIESRITNVNRGPVLTLYEMQIAPGIKVNKIVGLSDDIAMALAAYRVRIVAPIPGKSAIGVEIPNRNREMVTLGDVIGSPEYQSRSGGLKVGLGKDILGKPIMIDLKKLPHLLIAGATGSGKSVCVNSIISGLLYNYDPNYVRFILIDPKMVELQFYNGLPHLITPVITESHVAPRALKWATLEMERRYRLLSEQNARDIDKYNAKIAGYEKQLERLPYIVIIIDELADLMMLAAKEIEGFITRIAQKARAVGIHLVLATQRPSVNIITGVIKANFPARIAFQVAQKTDSRTIIDQNGAEKLLGKGDMLYQSPMNSFPIRIQGAFISEDETGKIVEHLRKLGKPSYLDFEDSVFDDDESEENIDEENEDRLFVEALRIIEETKKASASYLQRRLSIGYNRAARIIEMMEDRGYVGPQQGSKPREVYI